MKSNLWFLIILPVATASAGHAPSPLRDLVIESSVTMNATGKLFTYSYRITNPLVNDTSVAGFEIFIGRDPVTDQDTPSAGLTQCPRFLKAASASANSKTPLVQVGSLAPEGWLCGYARIADYPSGAFAWGGSSKTLLKPGSTLKGAALTSYAPPGIRDILVDAAIDYDQLPEEYTENIDLTKALTKKVNWLGKTVGPKAPPKIFNASAFSDYLRTLTTEAVAQKWIRDQGILKSLEAKLEQIAKKTAAGDYPAARNILNAFLSEVDAQKDKHLSSEAYALLYFNGKYLLGNLPEKVNPPAN